MSPHPCADHPCDHCYLCDVVGICCQSAQAAQHVSDSRPAAQPDPLHDAIVQDAKAVTGLSELVRIEARPPNLAGLLLPGLTAQPFPHDPRKETVHVIAARTSR
jgi:hypothetical protein